MELDPHRVGNLMVPLGTQFQITKHLNLEYSAQRAKLFCGCFDFEVLKVELDPHRVGNLMVPPRLQFQITKHLNLEDFAQSAKFFCGCFEIEALEVELDRFAMQEGPHNSTRA